MDVLQLTISDARFQSDIEVNSNGFYILDFGNK